MIQVQKYKRAAANDDFFRNPEPFQSRVIPLEPKKPVPTAPFPKFLFLEAA